MAYSKSVDFKRWIKKLKHRQVIFERNGDMLQADRLKRKVVIELKNHGL